MRGSELAFGHHRVEAARRKWGEDHEIPIILKDLSDEEMVMYFGRENLEDFGKDFYTHLRAWVAAKKFLFGNSIPTHVGTEDQTLGNC